MIPKTAIERAIQGGYKPLGNDMVYQYHVCNPRFWQALGKALGWEGEMKYWNGSEFQYHAHAFYDLILTGGDTDEFWSDILNV